MKVFLATFGCRANHYDTEAARAMLEAAGAVIVATPAQADAALFNSCAVTAQAEADLRQSVRRAARENPSLRTVVMGCAASLDRGAIRALPTVQQVVPGAELPEVALALGVDSALAAARPAVQTGARALLRIQDGCDEHCTFCATTLARGRNRSRPADDLIAEATRLAERHPEIVLTGIHVGTYGVDRGTSLSLLVERLVREVPGVRFRLSSVEATEVDDRLRDLFAARDSALVPYLHAPLQSGSDRLLRRMGRHWYTAARYAEAIERIVRDTPVFGLGADVIAGFPGETDDDHRATIALVESLPFTGLHVFPYSVRPGTAAERLPARVAPSVATERARELRALAERKAEAYRRSRVGGIADVVIVGNGARREGLTEDYLTVIPADSTLPRGARVMAKLEGRGDVLWAVVEHGGTAGTAGSGATACGGAVESDRRTWGNGASGE